MNDLENQVLGRFKSLLKERLPVFEIILFGSRARGDADALSDMDVVVILDGDADDRSRGMISDCAWEAGFEAGIVVVPIVFPRTEWESDAARNSLLGKAVAREGLSV
jgi:predicted nucleotidyltransferase